MDQDAEATVVVFRSMKDGEILALFPCQVDRSDGCCACYAHVGQHSTADYYGCVAASVPAEPREYADLKSELEGLGYRLEVRNRRPNWQRIRKG